MDNLDQPFELSSEPRKRQTRSRQAGELVATFDGYSHRWQHDDAISETIVGKATEETAGEYLRVDVKGSQSINALRPGLTYRFWGRHTTHERYGEQFWFESFIEETPVSREAVCLYLQQVDGIGPATAEAIWHVFGSESVEVFRERPDDIATNVQRVSYKQAAAGAAFLKKRQRQERGKMELMTLVHRAGVPKRIVDKALDDFGVEAATRIQRNPYLLMKYRGIGFLKTDRMYLDFGHNPTRLKRQALCCWYAIARDSEGHTWFPRTVARDALRKSIGGAGIRFEAAMTLAERAGLLRTREDGRGVWIAEAPRADAEGRLARLIETARIESREGRFNWPHLDQVEGLSDHQREEAAKSLIGNVAILAGSPGTGKTYVAAALMRAIRKLYPEALVGGGAPTGKAAVRLTESLERCGVVLPCRTIHSILGVESSNDGGFKFVHDARNPIPHKFLLLDESSMLDTPTFASLLAARPRGGHFLILGDPNQLAPVGHGAPLRDLLNCPESIPSGTLTEIRRNSGRGVQVCAEIRDKKPWQPSRSLDVDAGENLLVVDAATPEEQVAKLESLIRKFRDKAPRKYDPIWDVQVIVAVNKKGELSRRAMNKLLQNLLNPNGFTVERCPFRVGDKIVNTKNGLLKSNDPRADGVDQDGRVYVANGEQAEVVEVNPGNIIARMTNPSREVIIPRKAKSEQQEQAEEAAGGENPSAESDEAEQAASTGCSWDLGYAISAHKSQGSEWPVVIILLDTNPAAMRTCSRQWIYTAISRFKDFALMIGQKRTAEKMCGRDALFARRTFLKERIEELKAEADAAERPADGLEGDDNGDCVDEFDFEEMLEGVL